MTAPTSELKKCGPWTPVTGPTSDINYQFASHLAAAALNLLLVVRCADHLAVLNIDLEPAYDITLEQVDAVLWSLDGPEKVLGTVEKRDVELLVSNAGFGHKGWFASHSRVDVEAMFYVDAGAPLPLLHELIPRLAQRTLDSVIITGSKEVEQSYPWFTDCSTTKAFVHSLGQGLNGENRGRTSVNVLALAPDATDIGGLTLQGFESKNMSELMNPAKLAGQALYALGGKPFHIRSAMNRVFVRTLRLLPVSGPPLPRERAWLTP